MTITIDNLRSVRRLIVHRRHDGPCADGVASALLILDAIPGISVTWMAHGSKTHRELQPEPGLLFCDFVPYVERDEAGSISPASMDYLRELADLGTIVLDHHKGAADIVAVFGERGIFADEVERPGVSGALLAYEEVWVRLRGTTWESSIATVRSAFNLARLVGIRDTWQRKDPRWTEACAQAAALCFWPFETLTLGPGLDAMVAIGAVLLAKDAERARQSLAGAWRGNLAGLRVVIFEGTSHDASEVSDLAMDADLVAAFHYEIVEDGPAMKVSIRSRGAVDCSALAKRHGGGGHSGAGGFTHGSDGPGFGPHATLVGLLAHDLNQLRATNMVAGR